MTRTDPTSLSLAALLDAALANHGARKVALSLAAALIRARRARAQAARLHALDDHMRRDIGLPPRNASPPLPERMRAMW